MFVSPSFFFLTFFLRLLARLLRICLWKVLCSVILGYMVVVTSGFGVVRWKVLCRWDGGISVGLVVWTITKIRIYFSNRCER